MTATTEPTFIDLDTPATIAKTNSKQIKSVDQWIRTVPIDSDERVQWAVDAGHQIRDQVRGMEDELKSGLKPLKTIEKKMRGWFNPGIKAGKGAIAFLKQGITDYRAKVAQEHMAQLASATTHEEVVQTTQALAPTPTGYRETDKWIWKVADPEQIPRDYWILDASRIDREVRANKGNVQIPGIKSTLTKTAVFL